MLSRLFAAVQMPDVKISKKTLEAFDAIGDLPEEPSEIGNYLSKLWTMLKDFALTYGGRLLLAAVVVVIGFKIINVIDRRLSHAKPFQRFEKSARNFFFSVAAVIAKLCVLVTGMAILGVPMTSIVAIVASCGLTIGLALQGSLANIAGGFVLMLTRPYKIGDFLKFDDVTGTVESIGVFHTKILTIDNRRVIVPNATISNSTVVNFFALPLSRVDLTFTASYGDDVDLVEKTLLEVCDRNEKILKDPEPFARASAHKDSAMEYTLRAWVKSEDYWDVCFDLYHDVKIAFDKKGITIPFPQLDVHADRNPADEKLEMAESMRKKQ